MVRLSAFDLLTLSEEEQRIVRCLAQRAGLTAAEIARAAGLSAQQAEAALRELLRSARLIEQLRDGQRIFSVRFRREQQRARNVPASLRALLEQPADAFLAGAPLAAGLEPEARAELLGISQPRALMPGEVCVWQGRQAEHVGLVRSGLLRRSRLQGAGHEPQAASYLGAAEWFGLGEAFSAFPIADTYTAVTESELLLWPAAALLAFAQAHAGFSFAAGQWISRQLLSLAEHQAPGQIWVVDALGDPAPAAALALNLAALAARGGAEAAQPTVLWLLPQAGAEPPAEPVAGLDLLRDAGRADYPAEVQLDILLSDLQRRYQHIVCATGAASADELVLRLRGRAHALLTLSDDPSGSAAVAERWAESKPYGRPGQRRMAILGGWTEGQPLDPAFHLALPGPAAPAALADPDSGLGLAFAEIYRRLTLNHTIGIFVPSTVSVDRPIDSRAYVQSTLAFLGNLFGGATGNQAEGAWSSEDSGLVVEQVTIVRSFVSKSALHARLDAVIAFVTGLKQELQQEAIAVDVDNQLMLV